MYFEPISGTVVSREYLEELFTDSSLPVPPFDIKELGYFYINQDEKPKADVVERGEIVLRDSKYYQTWVGRSFNQEELLVILKEKKESYSSEITSKVSVLLEKGIPYTFGDQGTFNVQLRDGDRANLVGMRVYSETNEEEPQYFRTYENVIVALPNGQAVRTFTDAMFVQYRLLLSKAWALKDSLENSKDISTLEDIWENRDPIFKDNT